MNIHENNKDIEMRRQSIFNSQQKVKGILFTKNPNI